MSLSVNGLIVQEMRWLAGWSGVWIAELDYESEAQPTGKVAIVSTEGIAMNGTVDDKRSGTFGEKRLLRVIGGKGWGTRVRAQHYHSDLGVNLAVLVSTTAAEAGEVATVMVPKVLGTDYVRRRGAAGLIFQDVGLDWWVGLDGVTRVGVRVPTAPPPSLQVLDWQPSEGTVSFTCEVLVEPGTVLVDLRFGRRIVRQVEARVADGSVSGTLWVSELPPEPGESVNELADAFGELARAATRVEYSRFYEYVVIGMEGDRVELAAVSLTDGMPDVLPASVWAGASGYRATLAPGSRVLVGYRRGAPAEPFVAFYEPPEGGGWRPVALEIDAVGTVTIGATALGVVIGDVNTAQPIARVTPSLTTWIAAVSAYINGLAPGTAVPPIDLASTKAMSS